ncbi:hypothetical protein ACX0G9_23070 [Flavitalea flava]
MAKDGSELVVNGDKSKPEIIEEDGKRLTVSRTKLRYSGRLPKIGLVIICW